ncbi:MAG: hypothetical protein QXT80_04570 [Thermoplasmatales archaeon]
MKVTIPITILNSNPVPTPVNLVPVNPSGSLYLIGVRYSDDSIKLVSGPELHETFECDSEGTMYFNNHEDCSDTELTLSSDYLVPSGYNLVPYRAYIDSCNFNENIISGSLIMEIDGAIFKCEGWSKRSQDDLEETMDNFVLQTS